jgi:hypothetical protein
MADTSSRTPQTANYLPVGGVNMIFMVAAYAAFWIVTFLLVFSIFNRQRSLRRDLEMMEQLVESQEQKSQG